MKSYKSLSRQVFSDGIHRIEPIRFEDRLLIMKWRNEQMYHLRQNKILNVNDQNNYFSTVLSKQFEEEFPNQILFSYMEENNCIGYGGLVHINWIDRHAEISFLINTELEKNYFEKHWTIFLKLIEQVAFDELILHKIFTYAFDLRSHLYPTLEKCGFRHEASLKDHCYFEQQYVDVIIHSKIDVIIYFRDVTVEDEELTFNWAISPVIRKHSFSKDNITRSEHHEWFRKKLNDTNCCFYLAYSNNKVIGSIRFDKQDDEAMISYLIDEKFHGKGLGKKVLNLGVKHFLEKTSVKSVFGLVQKNNIPSLKVFRNLGYQEIDIDSTKVKFKKTVRCE